MGLSFAAAVVVARIGLSFAAAVVVARSGLSFAAVVACIGLLFAAAVVSARICLSFAAVVVVDFLHSSFSIYNDYITRVHITISSLAARNAALAALFGARLRLAAPTRRSK